MSTAQLQDEIHALKIRIEELSSEQRKKREPLINALDAGKHIVADIIHGVEYSTGDLQRWVNEAESAFFNARGDA